MTPWITDAGFLLESKHAVLYLVAWSIMSSTGQELINLRSIATVSLNSVAKGKLTTGRGGDLWKFLQMSQLWLTSSTSLFIPETQTPEFLITCLRRSEEGWANCLCNLSIFFWLLLPSSETRGEVNKHSVWFHVCHRITERCNNGLSSTNSLVSALQTWTLCHLQNQWNSEPPSMIWLMFQCLTQMLQAKLLLLYSSKLDHRQT